MVKLAALVGLCVVVSVVTSSLLLGGQFFTTREGDISDTFSQTLTVEIERRELVETLVTRGFVVETAPDISSLVIAGGTITQIDEKRLNAGLLPGSLLMEVDGNPRFLYNGEFPFYRPIVGGDTGPDVEELQRFLNTEGAQSPALVTDGIFGPSTQAALEQFYRVHGYMVPVGIPDSDQQVNELAESIRQATVEMERQAGELEVQLADLEELRSERIQLAETLQQVLTDGASEAELAAAAAALSGVENQITSAEAATVDLRHMRNGTEFRFVTAQTQLAELRLKSGPALFADHFVWSSGEVRVATTELEVGTVVESGVVVLGESTTRDRLILVPLEGGDWERVPVGARVLAGQLPEAMVVEIRPLRPEDPTDDRLPVDAPFIAEVATSADMAALAPGQSISVEIELGRTAGPVTAAPLAAVQTGADGVPFVVVGGSGDQLQQVTIEIGLVAQGWVEVTGDSIEPGDQVVIGDTSE